MYRYWAVFSAMTIPLYLLIMKHGRGEGSKIRFGNLWKLGFGSIHPTTTFDNLDLELAGIGVESTQIILANAGQILYSVFYLLYNTILTRVLLAHEWSRLGIKRNSLRVSSPIGN